jgi:hypothetical protein
MKKIYTKPSMKVYELNQRPQLLVGSDPHAPGYPGSFGYAPGAGEDMNKLASCETYPSDLS